jgi:ectoine hydroxylase-related dioxygenase (phytanoyl-CoA dioxygenase family)
MTTAPVLDDAEVAHFERDGFLVLPDFVDDSVLRELRRAYDEVIDREVRARGDRMLGGITRQVMIPSNAHPTFDRNDAVRRGIHVARALLRQHDVQRSFDMLIDKPPGHPHATPWHQDMSYADHPFAPPGSPIVLASLQFWVALDDVDADNGCMHFAPGFHRQPLLEHRVASGDPLDDSRLLELVDPERQLSSASVTAAPLIAGGATVHSYGTPHYTPPNRTDRPRRAYIFNIATADAARRIASHDRISPGGNQ